MNKASKMLRRPSVAGKWAIEDDSDNTDGKSRNGETLENIVSRIIPHPLRRAPRVLMPNEEKPDILKDEIEDPPRS